MKLPADLHCADVDSPLGPLCVAASPLGLVGVWFHDQRHAPDAALLRQWQRNPAHPLLREAGAQLRDYFDRARRQFDLPLDLSHGTAFQQTVWRGLLAIGSGQTLSYGELARRLGQPAAVRAVGAAVGRNPLSVVVPCHRVLGATGALTGYAGGLSRKVALLQLETGAGQPPTP